MNRELIIELTALMAVLITVIACLCGFVRGLKARRDTKKEEKK